MKQLLCARHVGQQCTCIILSSIIFSLQVKKMSFIGAEELVPDCIASKDRPEVLALTYLFKKKKLINLASGFQVFALNR